MYWKLFGSGSDQILAAKGFSDKGNMPVITLQSWLGGEGYSRATLVLDFNSKEQRDDAFFKMDCNSAAAIMQESLTEMKEQE